VKAHTHARKAFAIFIFRFNMHRDRVFVVTARAFAAQTAVLAAVVLLIAGVFVGAHRAHVAHPYRVRMAQQCRAGDIACTPLNAATVSPWWRWTDTLAAPLPGAAVRALEHTGAAAGIAAATHSPLAAAALALLTTLVWERMYTEADALYGTHWTPAGRAY